MDDLATYDEFLAENAKLKRRLAEAEAGLTAQQILPSIIRTCRKLNRDPFDYLENTLRSTNHTPLFNTR